MTSIHSQDSPHFRILHFQNLSSCHFITHNQGIKFFFLMWRMVIFGLECGTVYYITCTWIHGLWPLFSKYIKTVCCWVLYHPKCQSLCHEFWIMLFCLNKANKYNVHWRVKGMDVERALLMKMKWKVYKIIFIIVTLNPTLNKSECGL